MREIFYELIKEASNTEVIICDDVFEIGFNTIIEEDNLSLSSEENLSCLIIRNKEKFFKLLEEYIELENKHNRKIPNFYKEIDKNRTKWIISFLFANATPEDFINPEEFLRKRLDFIKDTTLDTYNDGVSFDMGKTFFNSKLIIKNNEAPLSVETPMFISISLEDENKSRYNFPNIYYAIREENGKKVCYIYGMKQGKEKESTEEERKFNKKINRLLFKLNDGVTSLPEYSSSTEENIKDVSMSFVLALNIFVSILQSFNIDKIKAVPYLPVRYLSRDHKAKTSEKREELEERNNRIQDNLTNKFIRTFRRLSFQNKDVEIVGYPYEYDEYLTVEIKPRKKELDNMLLEETNKKISDEKIR